MMSREQLTKDGWHFTAAIEGNDWVICYRSPTLKYFGIYSCAKSTGQPERRATYYDLCDRALSKLGYRRDKRCRTGWRYVSIGGAS